MNWGHKIALSFVFFAAFILFMVVRAFEQDFDLVAEDYYAQEINYQQQLQEQANLKELGQKVKIDQSKEHLVLTFPNAQSIEKGEVYFYHPSKKLLDKKLAVVGEQLVVNNELLVPGHYQLNIQWTADGMTYLQKEKVFIQ